jgi:hypothetical protein
MKTANENGYFSMRCNAKSKLLKMMQVLILLVCTANFGCSRTSSDREDLQSQQPGKDAKALEKEVTNAKNAQGVVQVNFPQDDPGAPLYVRTTRILNQLFVTDGWLVIPFHRDPQCVREDFNLLELFDAPAAFSCRLMTEGFYMIEKDAPAGTLPIIVQSTGSAVPFWFVRWDDFSVVAADGIVTLGELRNLNPLTGVATKFKETLRPRFENHLVNINASGVLKDGGTFSFHVNHVGDQTKNIQLTIKQ